jgi:hypothetical protein
MFTKEERDRMRQELLESFRPQPPPPKPTPTAISEERWANPPHEAIAAQAAASAEAFAKVVQKDTYEARRRKQEAKEVAEWSSGYNDPRIRYQRELDRFMEASRIIEAEAEQVYVGGFLEPRYRTTCHKGRGDPDWGL